MRYFGKIQDPKDLITKEYADTAIGGRAAKAELSDIFQTGSTCTEANGIAKGVFFYLDNELVVAKTAIANGATFTNGTNYEAPTAGALNALKSALDNVENNTDSFASGITGVKYISKKAGVVSINFQNVQGLSAHDAVVMTLSAGFRPRNNLTFTGFLRKGSGWASATFYPVSIYIQTTGTIQIAGNTTEISNGSLYAAATFFAG